MAAARGRQQRSQPLLVGALVAKAGLSASAARGLPRWLSDGHEDSSAACRVTD